MRSRLVACIAGLAGAVLVAAAVMASHSVPSPKNFWDSNLDAVPGPEQQVDATGAGWTQSKLDRLTSATATWADNTTFDITRTVSGAFDVFIDGTFPPAIYDSCITGGWVNNQDTIAIACREETFVAANQYGFTHPAYYRMHNNDIYFNVDYFTFHYGSAHTGLEDVADFQGVATHELGHWVRLKDVPQGSCTYTSTGLYTMCGTVLDLDDDTWRWRSLHTDDVSSANAVY